MKIEVYQGAVYGNAVVAIEGDTGDSPEAVAKAYLETQKILREEEAK